MTEASKQRMEKHLEDAIERWTLGYDENTSFRVLGTELYQAGMQDPDANKKPYNIIYGDEENLYRLYCEMEKIAGDRFKKIEKLEAENKRLRGALDFALPELERLNCDAPINLSKHTGQVLINIEKALLSGGE
jgi:hypothetical protein